MASVTPSETPPLVEVAPNENITQAETKKPTPPTIGLAIVADLWLWGALILYAPTYLGVSGGWEIIFYVFGFIALTFSFGGALLELGKLLKSEGLNYWAVGLVFLIPSVLLYVAVERQYILGIQGTIAKVAVLLLTAIGGASFLQGIPYFFWKSNDIASSSDIIVPEATKAERRRVNYGVIANAVIAILSLATAIITLAATIWPKGP